MAIEDLRVAREFFQMHLPQDLQSLIRWESLEQQPNAQISIAGSERITDVAFKVLIDKKESYLHLLVDHQSTPDILMPFRVENYRMNLIDAYVKQHPETKTIPLVIPIVLYHGISRWSHDMNINSLVDAPKALVDAYAFKPFIFIDLNQIADEDLRQHLWSGVMQLALKHIFSRDILPHVRAMMDLLSQLEQRNNQGFVETVLKYIMNRGEMNQNAFLDLVKTQLSPDMEGKIMTVSEQLIAKGVQEGPPKGHAKRNAPCAFRNSTCFIT